MLACLPMSWCSGNYRILGAVAGEGAATFALDYEQGEVTLGSVTCEVCKRGLRSGTCTLEIGGRSIARAEKPSAMFRHLVIAFEGRSFDLRASSVFTRNFALSEKNHETNSLLSDDIFDVSAGLGPGCRRF